MEKVRLTKTRVEAVAPGVTDILLWDAEIRGFGLKVTPAGNRTYVLQYSRANRTRRYTIGRHGPELTAEQARREAIAVRGIIARGGDPARDRARDRAVPTMAVLAQRYLDEHAGPRKKASSAAEDRRLLDCHIRPLLGDRQVSDVTRADIRRFAQDVAGGATARDEKTAKKRGRQIIRGGKVPANRCVTLLSKMFALAIDWGYRPDGVNPCRGVERFDEASRERFLDSTELRRLGAALAAAETKNKRNTLPANIIRLLLLTGARSSEIVTLRREHVALEQGLIRLPDSKTGAKVIILSAPARDLLATVLETAPEIGFVFPGRPRAKNAPAPPYGGLTGFWTRMRAKAKLGDARIHDLRHTHASIAAAGGISLPVIGRMLGHTQPSTTARYAHLADDPLRRAANAVAGEIAAALDGRTL